MAIALIHPPASFVQFMVPPEDHCIFGTIDPPLPVVYSSDVAFQIVLQAGSEGEANAVYNDTVNFGLVREYGDTVYALQFPNTAVRSKLAPTQILYNWGAGFPGFDAVFDVGECFRVMVELNGQHWWSKLFKRIAVDDEVCFSSVIGYSNDSGGFGFFGCGPTTAGGTTGDGGDPIDEEGNCIPMMVEIVNEATKTIPITQSMRDAYSELPSVQIWLTNPEGVLQNMGISAQFLGGYPPDRIYVDLGGPASGWVRIGK